MTEFTPLRISSEDDFERRLLCSTDREEPSPEALSKTALALGLGASALAVTSGAGAASGLGGAVSTSLVSLTLKSLLVGALGGLAVSTSAHAVFSGSARTQPTERAAVTEIANARTTASAVTPAPIEAAFEPAAPPPANAPEPPARSAPAPRRATAAARTVEIGARPPARTETSVHVPPPQVVATPAPAGAATVAPASRPESTISIADQVRTVASARQALKDGRAADALAQLRRYRARWPDGVLSTDVAVLTIEAELALGDRLAARRSARAFIAAQPDDRYAARVRALFEAWELE